MKHVFSSMKKDKDRLTALLPDIDPIEARIETVSRVAGPIALILGYIAIYALYRYFFG